MEASDGALDDVIVTWEDLSDGEQMLLGRMSLLLLLSGRHGSLLLLDEPETHFNDSWKREIIDIVDDNILRTTAAHVIVSTHTSIALSGVGDPSVVLDVIQSSGSRLRLVEIENDETACPECYTTFPISVCSLLNNTTRVWRCGCGVLLARSLEQ